MRSAERLEHTLWDAEQQRVLEALSAASGVPVLDLRGCGVFTQLGGFELRLHATEVTLTQRGFLTISASEFARRLGAEIVSADAELIYLKR